MGVFNYLERLRQRMEAEANDPNHVPWQDKHNIGKTSSQQDEPFSGKWQAEAEKDWNEKHQSWADYWLNGPRK